MRKAKLYKELFNMVYQWGRVGLVTDEHSNAFQGLIKKIEKMNKGMLNEYCIKYTLKKNGEAVVDICPAPSATEAMKKLASSKESDFNELINIHKL